MNSYELTRNSYATVTEEGLGPELDEVTLHQLESLLLATFIIEICWGAVMWIVKYSILAFYWRIFCTDHRSTRFIIWTLVAFVTCWGVSVVRFRLLMLVVFADSLRLSRCFSPSFDVLLSIHNGGLLTAGQDVILTSISCLWAYQHHILSLI